MSNRFLITVPILGLLVLSGGVAAQDEQPRPITNPEKVQAQIQAAAASRSDSGSPFAAVSQEPAGESPFAPQAEPERPAATVLTRAEREFVKEEEALLREIRLLDLRIEVSERQKKLEEPIQGLVQQAPTQLVSTPQVVAAPKRKAAEEPADAPLRLASIWGTPSNLKAEFVTPVGNRVVGIGERVHDGWELESLHQGAAIVRKGQQTRTLKMGI